MSAVFNIQGIEVVEVRDGDGGIGDIMRPRIVLPLLRIFHGMSVRRLGRRYSCLRH